MSQTDPSSPNGAPRGEQRQSPSEALRDLFESHSDEGLRCLELCPICRAADVLRATAPDELRDQLHVVQREALLTLKALIDRYVERLDDERGERGPRVEDIPIS